MVPQSTRIHFATPRGAIDTAQTFDTYTHACRQSHCLIHYILFFFLSKQRPMKYFRLLAAALVILLSATSAYAYDGYRNRQPKFRRAKPLNLRQQKLVFVPIRLGARLWGEGEVDIVRNSDLNDSRIEEYDDISGPVVFEVDLLYQIPRSYIRLGGGFLLVPNVDFKKARTGFRQKNGTEANLLAIIEAVLPTGQVDVFGRGIIGISSVWAGPRLNSRIENAEDVCFTNNNCDVSGSPYFGFTAGLGAGAIFPLPRSPIAIRAEFLWQYYDVDILTVDFDQSDVSDVDEFSGHRFFFMAGIEL